MRFPYLFDGPLPLLIKALLVFMQIFVVGSVALKQTEAGEQPELEREPIPHTRERENAPVTKPKKTPEFFIPQDQIPEKDKPSFKTGSEKDVKSQLVPPPPSEPQEPHQVQDQTVGQRKTSSLGSSFLYDLFLVLLGGVTAGIIMIFYFQQRRYTEYRSLLFGFSKELVLAFNRCGETYYRQYKTGMVSYSAIFVFTDASMVSRLANVTDFPPP